MKPLLEIIKDAEKKRVAIGHFNFSNWEQLRAIVSAAARSGQPVILGLSEGEREFVGSLEAVALARHFREKRGWPVYLNADHTYSLEKVREAAEAGFDSVIFDGAKLPFEENLSKMKEAVRIAKRVNGKILVEGELGYIGQSSQVLSQVPAGAAIKLEDLPTVEQCKKFVKETKIDLFAPAVGNVHGIILPQTNADGAPTYAEKLYIERIGEIKKVIKIPLVLHGGSGLADGDFKAGIEAGISIIHISTELRVVWRQGMEISLQEHASDVAPYKILAGVVGRMEEVVERRLRLFGGL